ncbi:MAG: hypothetical protein ACRDJJ_07370 [Actinomycetota bacterium]
MKGATAEREEATRWALRLLAIAWLALWALGGWILFFVGGLSAASLFGDQPSAGDLRTASWFTVGAGAAWAGGPLGVWIATRRRGWLIAAVVVLVLACAGAVAYLVESFDATGPR